jgi:hypothetical protein
MDNAEKELRFEYHGGPVLSRLRFYLVYWGSHWKTNEGRQLVSRVTESAGNMVDGGYLSQLAQYNRPPGQPFEVMSVAAVLDDGSDPPNPFADSEGKGRSDVRDEIKSLIDRKVLDPHSDPNSDALYMVIMPRGLTCSTADDDGETGAGQHFYFDLNGRNIYYGWVRSGSSERVLERITTTLSEELVEAITDPIPGTGWVASEATEDVEVCDACEGVNARVNGVLVKTYYSNEDRDCVTGKLAALPAKVGGA